MDKRGRLLYLDGLRGISALVVVLHHLVIGFLPSIYTRSSNDIHLPFGIERLIHDFPILGLWCNGGFAVIIFLILSGMSAAISSANVSIFSKKGVKRVLMRWVKFVTPMLICNMLAFLLVSGNLSFNQQAGQFSKSWWWLSAQWKMEPNIWSTIKQAGGGLFQTYKIEEVYNSSIWTMPYFFLGSILVLLLSSLMIKFKWKSIVYGLLVWLFLPSYYAYIFLGPMIIDLLPYLNRISFKIKWVLLGTIALGLSNYPQAYLTADKSIVYAWLPVLKFAHTSSTYYAIAAVALLLILGMSTTLQKMLSYRWCQYLGSRSFVIYLTHILLINSLVSYVLVASYPRWGYLVALGMGISVFVPSLWLIVEGVYWSANRIESEIGRAIG